MITKSIRETKGFTSILGHKNFLYPGKTSVCIPRGSIVKRVPWVAIGKLLPFKIETKSIFELYQINSNKKYSIIWIDRKDIQDERD